MATAPTAREVARAAAARSALRRFLARTEQVAGTAGLTARRYDLLLQIKAAPGERTTVTELARRLAAQQTAVTELVKRAEEAGLVARSPSPDDGRVSLLSLTREGERRLQRAFVALRHERLRLAQALLDLDGGE